MKEMQKVFLNGDFVDKEDAKISVFDRGFIFGDGVYEVVPVVNARLVDRLEFWERFEKSLASCELSFPYKREEFEEILYKLINTNSLNEGGVYIQLTRGVASRDFKFIDSKPTVMAFAFAQDVIKSKLLAGVSVITLPDIRWKRRDIKSISLLGQCMSKNQAAKAKAFEAVMVENGLITEGSSSNVSIIKNEVLITKPTSSEILAGIRRGNIISLAKALGIEVEQRAFSVKELLDADEAFLSAATLLLLPIIKVDGKQINDGHPGKISLKLRKAYEEKMLKESQG